MLYATSQTVHSDELYSMRYPKLNHLSHLHPLYVHDKDVYCRGSYGREN